VAKGGDFAHTITYCSKDRLVCVVKYSAYNIMLLFIYLFIYLFKNSTQYKQYKIEDTIKAVEF